MVQYLIDWPPNADDNIEKDYKWLQLWSLTFLKEKKRKILKTLTWKRVGTNNILGIYFVALKIGKE